MSILRATNEIHFITNAKKEQTISLKINAWLNYTLQF